MADVGIGGILVIWCFWAQETVVDGGNAAGFSFAEVEAGQFLVG